MTSDDVRASIRSYVTSTFHVRRVPQIGDEDSLLDAQLIDSLGILQLVGYLEETFGIEVTDEDLTPENFDSIGALTRYVSTRLAQR